MRVFEIIKECIKNNGDNLIIRKSCEDVYYFYFNEILIENSFDFDEVDNLFDLAMWGYKMFNNLDTFKKEDIEEDV